MATTFPVTIYSAGAWRSCAFDYLQGGLIIAVFCSPSPTMDHRLEVWLTTDADPPVAGASVVIETERVLGACLSIRSDGTVDVFYGYRDGFTCVLRHAVSQDEGTTFATTTYAVNDETGTPFQLTDGLLGAPHANYGRDGNLILLATKNNVALHRYLFSVSPAASGQWGTFPNGQRWTDSVNRHNQRIAGHRVYIGNGGFLEYLTETDFLSKITFGFGGLVSDGSELYAIHEKSATLIKATLPQLGGSSFIPFILYRLNASDAWAQFAEPANVTDSDASYSRYDTSWLKARSDGSFDLLYLSNGRVPKLVRLREQVDGAGWS
jgi:hypothetical protein